jgi:ankyrin repeat protein
MRQTLQLGAIVVLIFHGIGFGDEFVGAGRPDTEPTAVSRALHGAAVGREGKERVALLLAKGADVHAVDEEGRTAIHAAIEYGSVDTVKLLIEKGGRVNAKDHEGRTALHEAAWNGRRDMAECLLGHGAAVDARDHEGRTALHRAAHMWYRDVAELLLARGADVNARDKTSSTPLHATTRNDLSGLIRAMDAIDALMAKSGSGLPTRPSARMGRENVASLLVAKGANVRAVNGEGMTPLHYVTMSRNTSMMTFLLEKGADVNAKDGKGESPLHKAALEGFREEASLLTAQGADVQAKNNEGRTALHEAGYNGDNELFALLVAKGADGGVADGEGRTANSYLREAAARKMIVLSAGGDGPYCVIITAPIMVRRYVGGRAGRSGKMWIPAGADIERLGGVLKTHLEGIPASERGRGFDREYVLGNLAHYNREYTGFLRDGKRYVVCQMVLMEERFLESPDEGTAGSARKLPENRFSSILDGGCSVVHVTFDLERRAVVRVFCNGM